MNTSRLKRVLPGLALIIGAMAGSALAMVPGPAPETTDTQAVRMICSASCKPCYTQNDCGQGEGSCGVWRCINP
ncbi:hypothetical protein JYK02_33080 [Corallococcus macrosporus]|uniref:Uncharacterized protein n=1 Tax=Corallococcus macrosporus TaxID=35 RepID=A0ABS3DM50_9BACT|nr:hypothetical protein [Corallococcus macrosporus]MBN8232358.1 hypothetical protein [Corallococcus macrosporus]